MREFRDKKGREILIENESDVITAFHKGVEIGAFHIREEEQADGTVVAHAESIELGEQYRGSGIGTELVHVAFNDRNMKIIPPDTYYPDKQTRNTISESGMALIKKCQHLGFMAPFSNLTDDY